MAFASLRARLPTQAASNLFSTLSALPASAAWGGAGGTARAGSSASASSRDGLRSAVDADEEDADGEAEQRADAVLRKLIWQAGVDAEGRPIVCLAASLLPDPTEVAHDLLLSRIVLKLSSLVQQDYVLVCFAAGGQHARLPSPAWFWAAWGRLGKPFRKNIKRLYLVHPTFFTKMLFSLAAPLVSPKFFSKVAYVRTLTDLAREVPLGQVLVPPAALREDLLLEQTITLPSPLPPRVFGLPLSTLMPPSSPLPPLIRQATSFLRSSPSLLATEGLFRKSPSHGLQRAVEQAFDRGSPVDLGLHADAHLAAALIKAFFRGLAEPLFASAAYGVIRACPREGPEGEGKDDVEAYIKAHILSLLSAEAQHLLGHVIYLLHDVSLLAATNLMPSANLAIVFTPNLIRSSSPQEDALLFLVPSPNRPRHPNAPSSAAAAGRPTTLGEVVRYLIDNPGMFPEEYRGTGELADDEAEGQQTDRPRARLTSTRASSKVLSGELFVPPSPPSSLPATVVAAADDDDADEGEGERDEGAQEGAARAGGAYVLGE